MKCPKCGSEKVFNVKRRRINGGAIMVVAGLFLAPMLIGIPIIIAGISFVINGSKTQDNDYCCGTCENRFEF
jgi:hypothetical protein